jgi:hypothetical protein
MLWNLTRKSILTSESFSIFLRVSVSLVSLLILFLKRTRIMFLKFMIFESTQNDALFLTIEIWIEIATLIC